MGKKYLGPLQPVQIKDIFSVYKKQMHSALFLPGRVDGVSLCTEFMYRWFMNKFGGEGEHFFHAVNLDGADPASYLKKWTLKDWIKRPRPKLSIIPKADIEFNRDYLDDDYNDIMSYINRHRGKETFFEDSRNGIKIGLISRLNKVDFTFKINVEQRPQQLDLYDHIFMSCRVGKTLTLYTGVDFLVPNKLIKRIAKDMHFEVDESGMPKDYVAFLEYLNKWSDIPFLYKIRHVTHAFEFYIRLDKVMVHIRDIEMEIDDGETEGMLQANYGIEMRCSVRFPSPKLFVMYSFDEFSTMVYRDTIKDELYATDLVLANIPTRNAKDWPIYVDGTYENDNDGECIHASLIELFKSSKPTNDILETVEYCKKRGLDPGVFIDIKVFNAMTEKEVRIDWELMMLHTVDPVALKKSTIVVYTDNNFIYNAMGEKRGYYKDRMQYKREP